MPGSALRLEDNFRGRGDDFYEALIRAHEGLSERQSHTLNARLVLILANQIGDLEILEEAIALAAAASNGTDPATLHTGHPSPV